MTKLLIKEIYHCSQCTFYQLGYLLFEKGQPTMYWCSKDSRDIAEGKKGWADPLTIPDWCPLPEKGIYD